ncbi:MAG: hypothetical protein L0196_06570 [candidate division Zixibacteria bacterium]|nr:hypothetical protein [candidate division Zixibacteria bacterium]
MGDVTSVAIALSVIALAYAVIKVNEKLDEAHRKIKRMDEAVQKLNEFQKTNPPGPARKSLVNP